MPQIKKFCSISYWMAWDEKYVSRAIRAIREINAIGENRKIRQSWHQGNQGNRSNKGNQDGLNFSKFKLSVELNLSSLFILFHLLQVGVGSELKFRLLQGLCWIESFPIFYLECCGEEEEKNILESFAPALTGWRGIECIFPYVAGCSGMEI